MNTPSLHLYNSLFSCERNPLFTDILMICTDWCGPFIMAVSFLSVAFSLSLEHSLWVVLPLWVLVGLCLVLCQLYYSLCSLCFCQLLEFLEIILSSPHFLSHFFQWVFHVFVVVHPISFCFLAEHFGWWCSSLLQHSICLWTRTICPLVVSSDKRVYPNFIFPTLIAVPCTRSTIPEYTLE